MLSAVKNDYLTQESKIEIEIQNLSKIYKTKNGSFQALENVSLYVKTKNLYPSLVLQDVENQRF